MTSPGSVPEPAERRWQIGDIVEMRSGPKWRRDRGDQPQWVGPFGDRTSDREMSRVASAAGGPDQSMRCTCDPWDQPYLTPACRVHNPAPLVLPVPATPAACARCPRPVRWKVLTAKGDRYSCGIHVNAVVNTLGAHRAEIVSTNPFTKETP